MVEWQEGREGGRRRGWREGKRSVGGGGREEGRDRDKTRTRNRNLYFARIVV